MSDILLKDAYGHASVFTDVRSLKLNTQDGSVYFYEPSGSCSFSSNGTYRIAGKNAILVSVPQGGGQSEVDAFITKNFSGVSITTNVSYIGQSAFQSAKNININAPNAVKISSGAFMNCSSAKITVNTYLNTVAESAFKNATGVEFGSPALYISYIGSSAFESCAMSVGLQSFYFTGTTLTATCKNGCPPASYINLGAMSSVPNNFAMYTNQITTLDAPNVTTVGTSAFRSCTNLVSTNCKPKILYSWAFCGTRLSNLDMSNLEEVRGSTCTMGITNTEWVWGFSKIVSLCYNAFYGTGYHYDSSGTIVYNNMTYLGDVVKAVNVTEAIFPKVTTTASSIWYKDNFPKVETLRLPKLVTVPSKIFSGPSTALSKIYLNSATYLSASCFYMASRLMEVHIGTSNCRIYNSYVFKSTPIVLSTYTGTFGSIYVPSDYVSTYQSATNWVYLSSRITAETET